MRASTSASVRPSPQWCIVCSANTRADAVESAAVRCNVREFAHETYTLWRCRTCSSIHCEGEVDLRRYYSSYPLKRQKLGLGESIGYRNRMKLLRAAGVKRSDRVLDFGCGSGLFVTYLKSRRYRNVYGCDPYVDGFARQPEPLGPFDVVTSWDVIEHDDDPRAFMGRVGSLVRPGGLVVIGTPNAEGISMERTGDPSLHPPYHRHILSKQALLRLGRERGLQPVHIHHRSFYDSLVPTVNSRFMWRYIERTGGFLDAAVEPPKIGIVLRSPVMLFLALFGFFLPAGDNMVVLFRKPLATG